MNVPTQNVFCVFAEMSELRRHIKHEHSNKRSPKHTYVHASVVDVQIPKERCRQFEELKGVNERWRQRISGLTLPPLSRVTVHASMKERDRDGDRQINREKATNEVGKEMQQMQTWTRGSGAGADKRCAREAHHPARVACEGRRGGDVLHRVFPKGTTKS